MQDNETKESATVYPPVHLSWCKRLAFVAAFLGLVLGGGEVLCRLLGLGRQTAVAEHVSRWQTAPDGERFWVIGGSGYNNDGMRDREHSILKPPETYRIVCLGDSVTVGHGVERSETYPFILESYLRQLGLRVEVFNIAVSGWSTYQQVLGYKAVARKYKPDHVFVGFCLNDVAEMYNNLREPPSAPVSFLVRNSAMARWLVGAERRQVHHVRELFTKPESPAVQTGWEQVFEQLLLLRSLTAADGCELSVVIFPFRFQLDSGAPRPIAQRKLFSFCRQNGIPCLDLLPALFGTGPEAMIDESHLAPEGARIVAEEMVRWGRTGCVLCGYDLSGLDATQCPRCAHPIGK